MSVIRFVSLGVVILACMLAIQRVPGLFSKAGTSVRTRAPSASHTGRSLMTYRSADYEVFGKVRMVEEGFSMVGMLRHCVPDAGVHPASCPRCKACSSG